MKKRNDFICMISMALSGILLFSTGCAPEKRYSESVGSFSSLEEAYENGWLTQDDLKNIAYYFHAGNGETEHLGKAFVPDPKMPESLDEETQYKIKRTYLNEVIDMPDGSFDRVVMYDYFGTYNDNVVVCISDTYHGYDYVIEPEHEIGGDGFYEYCSEILCVWREKIMAG